MIACGADRAACGRIVPRNAFVAVPCLGRKVHRFPRATHNKPHASSAEPVKLEEVDWDSVDWDTYDWRDYVDDAPGPAFKHTLQALEWEAVCKQIASFASTFVGKKQCQNIEIARTLDRALVCTLACGFHLSTVVSSNQGLPFLRIAILPYVNFQWSCVDLIVQGMADAGCV